MSSEYNICRNMPCQHGGICTTSGGNYKCQCQLGYSGENCQGQYSPISTIQYYTIQYNHPSLQYNTIQYNTITLLSIEIQADSGCFVRAGLFTQYKKRYLKLDTISTGPLSVLAGASIPETLLLSSSSSFDLPALRWSPALRVHQQSQFIILYITGKIFLFYVHSFTVKFPPLIFLMFTCISTKCVVVVKNIRREERRKFQI